MLLELTGIYKNYIQGGMDVPVLKNINLNIDEGEYVAIMGPSGSGMSTLMNIVGCLDKPTEGTFMLDGEDISKMNDKRLSAIRNKYIGFVSNILRLESSCANPLIEELVQEMNDVYAAILSLKGAQG